MVELHDLSQLKDDMTAFIEGHGMKRFPAFVGEDVTSLAWDSSDPDSWKDFVELAKHAGANFLTVHDFALSREDVDYIVGRLRNGYWSDEGDVEDARALYAHVGRTGFIQMGWANAGVLFLHETSTEWYDRYQSLLDMAEECGGWNLDQEDTDSER